MKSTHLDDQMKPVVDTESTRPSSNDLVLSVILLILSLGTIILSIFMPRPGGWVTSPGLFPLLIGLVLFGMGISLLNGAIRSLKQSSSSIFGKAMKDEDKIFFKRLFVAIGGILIYTLVIIPLIHFTIATIIYLTGTLWYFWNGKFYKILIISILTSFFLAETFSRVFQIILP